MTAKDKAQVEVADIQLVIDNLNEIIKLTRFKSKYSALGSIQEELTVTIINLETALSKQLLIIHNYDRLNK